jgi:hypothetical protein
MTEGDQYPNCALDWILPFRREDNAAWEKANTLGRILFPFYILFAAFRTVMVNGLMLAMLVALIPYLPILWLEQNVPFRKWWDKLGAFLKGLVCKP